MGGGRIQIRIDICCVCPGARWLSGSGFGAQGLSGAGPSLADVENRVLVAFYSRRGHTRNLAREVCKGLEATRVQVSCLELEPKREHGLFGVGTSSLTRTVEPLADDCCADLEGVNLLVLGTPVWGGFPAPYLRSLLEVTQDLKGLPVVLFATCAYGDRGAEMELREMVRSTGGRPMDYHIWRIRRDGTRGLDRTTEAVVGSALALLPKDPSRGPLDG